MVDSDETHKNLKNLYLTDEYILKNPSIHEEDSPWKINKIIPLINNFISNFNKNEVFLLDVGGGAGLILNAVADYIKDNFTINVNKFAIDLSPGILKIQKKNNPDLIKILNQDIRKTSFLNKEIDLTLMIDVLEHVPNPIEALVELRRISRYVILKVPLEDNLYLNILNLLKRGKIRADLINNFGHINIYNYRHLISQIMENTGQILLSNFTNVFDYYLNSEYYKDRFRVKERLANIIAKKLYIISPILCSLIFNDFVIMLVKCY